MAGLSFRPKLAENGGIAASGDAASSGAAGFVRPVLLVLAAVLSGCAYAPGMHTDSEIYDAPESWPRESGGAAEPIPQENITLRAIDAALIREQQQTRARPFAPNPNPDLAAALKAYEYRVGPQDILSITVFDHPELTIPAGSFRDPESTGFVVNAQGTIYFPFAGEVEVAGKTTEEIRVLLTERLVEYIQDPKLQVRVSAFRSKRVTVTGNVVSTNTIPIRDVPLTALDAVNSAGEMRMTAETGGTPPEPKMTDLSRVILYRDGEAERLDLRALLVNGDMSQNRLLQDGDILYVPDNDDNKIFMLGEFVEPRTYPVDPDGVTLAEAISNARGFDLTTSDPSRLYVIRGTPENPEVFWLNAREPHSLVLADQFQLMPRDVVYASTADVSKIGRLMGQLQPILQITRDAALIAR